MQRNTLFQTLRLELDPTQAAYSVPTMQVVMDAKKFRLNSKGRNLNCYVLNGIGELNHFMTWLENIKKSAPNNARFQYVMKYSQHWTSADITIKDGRLEFFLLDSIHSRNIFVNSIEVIKKISPDAIITVSSGMPIQRNDIDCGTFSYDFVCQMAKIPDLHDQIKGFTQLIHKNDRLGHVLLYRENDGSLRTINVNDFPRSLSPLLRNIEDVPKNSIWFRQGFLANKHLYLNEYILQKGHAKETVDGTLASDAILHKRISVKNKTSFFYVSKQAELRRDPRNEPFAPEKCRI